MGETMTADDIEKEWADRARRFLKAELKRAEISYAELARRLNAKGFTLPKSKFLTRKWQHSS